MSGKINYSRGRGATHLIFEPTLAQRIAMQLTAKPLGKGGDLNLMEAERIKRARARVSLRYFAFENPNAHQYTNTERRL